MEKTAPRARRRTQPTPRAAAAPGEAAPACEDKGALAERLVRERQQIEQARASAAAGRTVSLNSVSAWVDSWDTANELPMPRSRR